MFIELHVIQNFAPSNLNRDDTGAPKDCEFGGYRRARISSQCLKRAMRGTFRDEALLAPEHLAKRTKRLVEELTRRLADAGRPAEEARRVVEAALGGMGLGVGADGKTQYLLFVGEAEAVGEATAKAGRDAKKAGKAVVPPAVTNALKKVLDGGRAADVALFGRMLADLPDRNVDAAAQVAHAISTHKVSIEFDFYTAVDDLKPEDTAGADMLGTVEFNSACFYRYANVDLAQLARNLGGDKGDEALARRTLEAFLRAAVAAVPTGKQNSMAAQNPPSLVFTVARDAGLWSLANAFVRPVSAGHDGDLVQQSIARLDDYWGRLTRMYGRDGIAGQWACSLEDDGLQNLAPAPPARVASIDELIRKTVQAASFAADSRGR